MKDVWLWILGSRSMWIGAVSTALVALILKYGQPALGLTEEQAKQIAEVVVVVALAVIGKLAAQNVVGIVKGAKQ
jgi:hypothetical protein